jgi:adenylate cyclase class IV
MKHLEIETKYRAESVPLKDFQAFCEARNPTRHVIASGYDHFYSNVADPNSFGRHRRGPDKNELTFKRKTTDANNYVRTEYNIQMGADSSVEKVAGFFAEMGYQYNTSIFKNCFVYQYGHYTLVYYVVYDTQLQEKGRFIEIELDEDEHWESEREAMEELRRLEHGLNGALGSHIHPTRRVKDSLYEMFKVDNG